MTTNLTDVPQGTGWVNDKGQLYVDTTTLTAMAHCSTEAMVRYGFGYQAVGEMGAPLKSGIAGHEALATYFKTGDAPKALLVYKDLYREWADEHVPDPDDRLSYDNTSRVLDQWFRDHPIASLPFYVRPDLVEIPFAHQIADDVVLVGRIDLIGQNAADDKWYIVDNKFTGQITNPWLNQFRSSPQITGYMDAAIHCTDRHVVGAFVNAIEFSKLPDMSGITKCRTHGVPYTECAIQHTTKCKTHKSAWVDCAARHVRTCAIHDVPYNECANQHLRSRITMTTRDESDFVQWRRNAVSLARRFRRLLEQYPDIQDASKLLTQGTYTGRCVWCNLNEWCIGARRAPAMVETMLKYEPWRPWDYHKERTT